MALPPGFRFHPTDEELVAYYLKRKVAGRTIEFNIISEIDLYKQEPWDLPEKSFLPGSDMEWYFFSPRDKKYPNGLRTNRATEAGYWKATGKDRNVKKAGRVVGMKKTLVFYRGRAPHGERTDWVMHEYRLDEEECEKVHASQDLFVLCRVFKKSGVGPRSGEDRGPQTYVDDDIDKEPSSGSFAEAVKKALEPESTPAVSTPTPAPVPEPAAIESPKAAPIEKSPTTASTLSVDDYAPSEEAGEVTDMPTVVPLEDFILEEPNFEQNEEDAPFWDCFSSINADLDLPSSAVDSSAQQFPSSELFESWQADRETDAPSGMMWNSDLSNSVPEPQHPQLDEPNGGAGYMDMLQLELLESDDVLPPLVEELESNNLPNDSEGRVAPPNFGEDVNQQLRGRGPARARSRAARQLPTSDEGQQRARSSNDGLYRYEATPQQRMSNMNFRGPEVPSQAREGSTSSHTGSSSNHVDTNQAPPSADFPSSASVAGSGISGVPSSEENLFTFQDSFFDFPLDDELINMASGYESEDLSHEAPPELVGDQGSSDVNIPQPEKPVENSQSAASEGPPRLSSSSQEGPPEEGKPLSKPLAGLMKLLGSLPALPASAAECAPDTKPLHINGEVASTYSSIHLSAVTVTCTSSADGAQKVQAAVTDCRLQGDAREVYQQVASGSWQTQGSETLKPLCVNCDTAVGSVGLQRRVARGSNSGFVFVFVLGAVSALCWFLLIRVMWRLGSHVLTTVF